MHKRFLIDTIIYGTTRSAPPIVSLLLLPIFTSLLSPSEFGIVALFEVEATILTNMMMFGIDGVIPRYFNDVHEADLDSWISSGLIICMSGAVVFFALVASFAGPIVDGFLLQHEIYPYRTLVIVVALQASAMVPVLYLQVLLRMQAKPIAVSLCAFGLFVLRTSITLLLLFMTQYRVEAFVFGNTVASITMGLLCLILLKTHLSTIPPKKQLSNLARQSFFMWTHSLIATFSQTADRIALARWSLSSDLGRYAVAGKISNILQFSSTTLSYALQPYFFRKAAGVDSSLRKVIGFTVTILSALGIAIIAARHYIVDALVVGEGFQEAVNCVPFLILAAWLKHNWGLLSQGLVKSGRAHWIPLTTFAATIALVVALFSLVPTYGAIGACAGLAIYRGFAVAGGYWAARSKDSDMPWGVTLAAGGTLVLSCIGPLWYPHETVIHSFCFAITILILGFQGWNIFRSLLNPGKSFQ